jgi:hypothetical protein
MPFFFRGPSDLWNYSFWNNGNDPKINRVLPLPHDESCGNDPVVKNSIDSNGDLDL